MEKTIRTEIILKRDTKGKVTEAQQMCFDRSVLDAGKTVTETSEYGRVFVYDFKKLIVHWWSVGNPDDVHVDMIHIINGRPDTKEDLLKRYDTLIGKALKTINAYTGPRAVILPTNERAIDFDDSWLIIGTTEPFLRNKKDQTRRNDGIFDDIYQPTPLAKFLDPRGLVELATKLQKS